MLKSKRLYANVLVFGIFFFLTSIPWYVPFVIGLIYLAYIPYYELILLGFLIDLTYSSSHFFSINSHKVSLPFTILTGILVLIFQILKKRIRS